MLSSPKIEPLKPAQQSLAIDALVSSFEQDPLKIRLASNLKGRRRMLKWLLGGVVRYCLVHGEVYTDADVKGAACWLPPGKAEMRFWDTLRAWGLLPGTLGAMTPRQIWMSIEMQSVTERLHKRLMPDPHWYLFLLGVAQPYQGQGIGGKLIEPVLARASQERAPCYLETQTENNVAFYRKRGFEVIHQEQIRGLNMPIWFMKRNG